MELNTHLAQELKNLKDKIGWESKEMWAQILSYAHKEASRYETTGVSAWEAAL